MRRYTIEVAGTTYVIDVQELAADRFRVLLGDEAFEVYLAADEDLAEATITPEIVMAEQPRAIPASRAATPAPAAAPPQPTRPPPSNNLFELTAPLPGVVVSVAITPGERVERGQRLLVLEAMKMNNSIRSPQDGVVVEVLAQIGQTVRHGDVLLRFEQG
jgi:biotin carboxyl carrier protein